jgi:hypothetical protein
LLCFLIPFLNAQGQVHWESIVNANFFWKYLIGSADITSDWKENGFNDGAWDSGTGGIGYGDGDDNTQIPSILSVYLRYSFNVSNISDITDLHLYIDYDDGFIAYINGTEVARENMDNAGTDPAYDVLADDCTHEARIPQGGLPDLYIIQIDPASLLKSGTNTLAIEVHNCSGTSSDLSSSAWLIAKIKGEELIFYDTPDWFTSPPDGISHLPLVIINTNGQSIPDEPKINVNMKVIYNGTGKLNRIDDDANVYDGLIGIEIRGQSSQYFYPKDSYTVETRDSSGEDLKIPLLGMPEESDWVLYAPYSDKSLLRNAVSYYFASEMGVWAPRFRFCELYLNGDYRGIYLLMEKIKRDGDRVDIVKMRETHNAGDSLTGGYIVRVDKINGLTENIDYFYTSPKYTFPNSRSYAFTYYYPEAHKITPQQKQYIQDFIYETENSLNRSDYQNESHGYPKYLDPVSFADYQIIKEFGNDVDAYRYSQYFFKNADSEDPRLHAGPVWDHNLCYGNVDYFEKARSTNDFAYTNIGATEGHCMHWWYRLMQDPAYVWNLQKRYSGFRESVLRTEAIMAYINDQVAYLGDAIDRNFNRWPILGVWVWPNYYVGDTFENEINYLKNWITARLQFLDSQWFIAVSDGDVPASTNNGILVYPNPFSSSVKIEIGNQSKIPFLAKIHDLTGKLVYQTSWYSGEDLFLGHLEPGMYILNVKSGGETKGIVKIIRQY